MSHKEIETIVLVILENYCSLNCISTELNSQTPLIGNNRILDSMGLVNIIVDIETEFLDRGIEISLTSEAAMSLKISPFRTIGSLCNFIENQLGIKENG